jgi:nucleotidyltransferase/DNA polymerase involved in DNA repair
VQAPEEGLLGTFEQSDLTLEHPGFGKVGALRLIKVNAERIRKLLEQFDPDKTVEAVRRFTKHMEDKAGKGAPPNPQNEEMLKAAMVLLGDLKRAVTTEKGDLCLRRLTEAEAASEQAVSLVRKALQGPRIILS